MLWVLAWIVFEVGVIVFVVAVVRCGVLRIMGSPVVVDRGS